MKRSYESALKTLLEKVAHRVIRSGGSLDGLFLPTNVPGVSPIRLEDWLDARDHKRERIADG